MLAKLQRWMFLVAWLAGTGLTWWALKGTAIFLKWPSHWHLATSLGLGLLTLPLCHAIVLLLNFSLSEYFDRQEAWRHPEQTIESRGGMVAVLTAYLKEIPASVRVFGWLQPWRHKSAYAAWPQSTSTQTGSPSTFTERSPILFLHGYFCNRGMWHPLTKHWSTSSFGKNRLIEGISMEPAFGSIDEYAEQIHAAVTGLHKRTGRRPILIGHSMGGLAARAYLRHHKERHKNSQGKLPIKGLITIGTPHRGTALGELGHGKNVQQMRRDSDWLRALAAHERNHPSPPVDVILSLHDNIVSPRAMQTLPHATTHALRGHGHMRMVLDKDVWRLIESIVIRLETTIKKT